MRRLIEHGVELCAGRRRFEVVPPGETHIVKQRTLLFICTTVDDIPSAAPALTAVDYMSAHCPILPDKVSVAKYVSRFGLCLSKTLPTIHVLREEVRLPFSPLLSPLPPVLTSYLQTLRLVIFHHHTART